MPSLSLPILRGSEPINTVLPPVVSHEKKPVLQDKHRRALATGAPAARRLTKQLPPWKQPRPVVILHGASADANKMRDTEMWVREALPRAHVVNLDLGNGLLDSVGRPLYWQVEQFAAEVKADPRLAGGFNLIGYSQGSVVGRAYIQKHNTPKVYNFISWAGPQAGQFGLPLQETALPRPVSRLLTSSLLPVLRPLLLWSHLQNRVSLSNLWRCPSQPDCTGSAPFIADINNEAEEPSRRNATYASNMASLSNLVLVASPADQIVVPWQSAAFAQLEADPRGKSFGTILKPLVDSTLFREDRIGLKTLHARNKLHIALANVSHFEFPRGAGKDEVFDKYTLPFLKSDATLALPRIAWRSRVRVQQPDRARRVAAEREAATVLYENGLFDI